MLQVFLKKKKKEREKERKKKNFKKKTSAFMISLLTSLLINEFQQDECRKDLDEFGPKFYF